MRLRHRSTFSRNEQRQGVLEEVTITAQKREGKLQNVPIAITAITAVEIWVSVTRIISQPDRLEFAAMARSSDEVYGVEKLSRRLC